MEFSENYFKEEVLWGFKVTPTRKRYWAKILEMLEEVDRICKKHHLKYFAAGGTLLGAIRHKGFIPWDYDMDLNMMRDDYEMFCKIAQNELRAPFFLQTSYTDNCPMFYAKIRNSETTAATVHSLSLKYNNGIFLDIFPVDNMPDDESERERIKKDIAELDRFLSIGVRKYWHIRNEKVGDEEKKQVEAFIKENGWRRRFIEVENSYRKYNTQTTKQCAYVSSVLIRDFYHDNDDYDESILVPFENTMIPVPKNYDKILTKQYGDYMSPDKAHAEARPLLVSTTVPYNRFDPEKDAEEFL